MPSMKNSGCLISLIMVDHRPKFEDSKFCYQLITIITKFSNIFLIGVIRNHFSAIAFTVRLLRYGCVLSNWY